MMWGMKTADTLAKLSSVFTDAYIGFMAAE
jgi:hypothetical protein